MHADRLRPTCSVLIQDAALIKVTEMTKMMFDSKDASQVLNNGSAFEPMDPRQALKKTLRGKGGALLTSSALIAAATALTISGEAVAQGVPSGFAPVPSDVVSYVQLSNGSVLVQLVNQQSLLVTSNNFFFTAVEFST